VSSVCPQCIFSDVGNRQRVVLGPFRFVIFNDSNVVSGQVFFSVEAVCDFVPGRVLF
jgi:hypothetical protein